jgi:holo-ACP synthase CitX
MHQALLHARDARQRAIDRAREGLERGSVVFASTSVPGPDKMPPGLDAVFAAACERLCSGLDAECLARDVDALGHWALLRTPLEAAVAKRVAMEIETAAPARRLVDLDVYDRDRQLGRSAVGAPPRSCLVCDQSAADCIRTQRHGTGELSAAVTALLADSARHEPSPRVAAVRLRNAADEPSPRVAAVRLRNAADEPSPRVASVRLRNAADEPSPRVASARQAGGRSLDRLAACLVIGARVELALTPKPGLVDRDDNGSHPDLSFALMTRSIELLPLYFDELASACALDAGQATTGRSARTTLLDSIEIGRRAERRMLDLVGSNTHRGYIFLAGLTLLGAAKNPDDLRGGIRRVALDIAAERSPRPEDLASHGAVARREHAIGGIEREALAGLPSVFEHGLPALRRCRAKGGGTTTGRPQPAESDEPLHYAMAALMQVVEDTTAVHRRGAEALSRLRQDGARLQALIEAGRPYVPWLRELNAAYRQLNLTMGGVADCLALAIALDRWLEP